MQGRWKRYARGRKRHIPGEMNRTEQAYSEILESLRISGEIEWWKFESVKLKLAPKTFYTADFFVMTSEGELEVHEVKGGRIEDDAMVKIKVAASLFPFRFKLCVKKNSKTPWDVREIPGE